ncbi:unnamed protein product [[Actinomadura] parvosata subsp. kistnae]|nr:unnamed protein product [Actinomadura parvosata subsp. kistnae]
MTVVMRRLASSAWSTRSDRTSIGYMTEISVTPARMSTPNETTVAIVIRALMERPCIIRPTVPPVVQTAGQTDV